MRTVVKAGSPTKSCSIETIHALIKAQVIRTPHAVAVRCAAEAITYETLDRRANGLAHILRAKGISVGARVGILVPHSIETVIALLGVLKCGAAYVPFDPVTPVVRIRSCLRDADIRTVVTTGKFTTAIRGECAVVAVDADGAMNEADAPPLVQVAPEDVAYIIYSSGSTGTPKGILISHRALTNYVTWANSVYIDRGSDGALHSSLAFDLTVTSIFVPLTAGGAVVAYPARIGELPIVDVLRDDRVDFIKLTPSHLRLVVEQANLPKRVRTFIVGGENLDTALALKTHEVFQGRVRIFNEYGPTETTVGCMIHRFDPNQDRRNSVPLGRPGAGARIYLLDGRGAPVASGKGEIYIGGVGLALGYLNAPSLTAERFIPDPFESGQLMYRSGDLADRHPDGTIEYIGRIDDQIKLRGHRIHLSEIRLVLMEYPDIQDCVVRVVSDHRGAQVLVAYYVSDQPIDRKVLRAFALRKLMPATAPSNFVHLERLPLNTNGKVKIDSLPFPEIMDLRSPGVSQGPRTLTERRMAEIWRGVLPLASFGVGENFFEVGGDSISSVRLISEIQKAFGVRLPSEVMFREPTIEALSQQIDEVQADSRTSRLVPLRPGAQRRPLFLMPGVVGEVMSYVPLLQYLPTKQPVYALEDRDDKHTSGRAVEIESLASKYFEAIREVQPTGPYNLAGYSAGGITAFEIACQIQANGERVGLLAIIDGDPPPAVGGRASNGRYAWTRFIKNLAYLFTDDLMVSSASDLQQRFQSKARILIHYLKDSSFRHSQKAGGLDMRDIAGTPGLAAHQIPRLEAFMSAVRRYQPKRYDGRLTLLRARAFGLFQPVLHDRGWSSLVDQIDVRVLKGNHASILREPFVRQLAKELEELLGFNQSD
jgi:amino acid adenylation domain-containing protein